jgi:hypothetical protein
MSQTEQHGPFHIDKRGTLVHVQSHQAFSARLSCYLPVNRDGMKHVLPPFHLSPGETLVLSAVGYDDVVVQGGGAA